MYKNAGECVERYVNEDVGLVYKKVGGWVEGYVKVYRGGSHVHKGRKVY